MGLSTEFRKALEVARSLQSERRGSLRAFFSEDECDKLESARQSVRLDQATIVYCVYENPFAKSGGIFAVADNYCSALQAAGKKILIVTPFHTKLGTAPNDSDVRRLGKCSVIFGGESTRVELLEHVRNNVRWILLRAAGFFEGDGGAGGMDPYVDSDPTRLLTDSLFMSAAVPEALAALDESEGLMFHVQDWELAATTLTVKLALLEDRLKSAVVVLTSHNPYDHELPTDSLHLITNRDGDQLPAARSVYQAMMPLTDGPVTTVSQTFAQELTSDPLQTQYFADHLQDVFQKHGIIGVDNGLFGKPNQAYSDDAVQSLANGIPIAILNEKLAKRKRMLLVLHEYQDDRIFGHLDGSDGGPLRELSDSVPVFLVFGRMDPGQKGFDVVSRAIEALPRGWGRFILTPIITGGPSAFRDDLLRLAETRPGEVVIYPFRMEQGYLEAMAGATYAVMPSLYEPFGGATEPYLVGTPVVARATGGLVQQVTDVGTSADTATGILYREAIEGNGKQWRAVQAANAPAARMEMPIYRSMVDALETALTRAGEIYQSEPLTYANMLGRLLNRAQMFSWSRAMDEYAAVYELARS